MTSQALFDTGEVFDLRHRKQVLSVQSHTAALLSTLRVFFGRDIFPHRGFATCAPLIVVIRLWESFGLQPVNALLTLCVLHHRGELALKSERKVFDVQAQEYSLEGLEDWPLVDGLLSILSLLKTKGGSIIPTAVAVTPEEVEGQQAGAGEDYNFEFARAFDANENLASEMVRLYRLQLQRVEDLLGKPKEDEENPDYVITYDANAAAQVPFAFNSLDSTGVFVVLTQSQREAAIQHSKHSVSLEAVTRSLGNEVACVTSLTEERLHQLVVDVYRAMLTTPNDFGTGPRDRYYFCHFEDHAQACHFTEFINIGWRLSLLLDTTSSLWQLFPCEGFSEREKSANFSIFLQGLTGDDDEGEAAEAPAPARPEKPSSTGINIEVGTESLAAQPLLVSPSATQQLPDLVSETLPTPRILEPALQLSTPAEFLSYFQRKSKLIAVLAKSKERTKSMHGPPKAVAEEDGHLTTGLHKLRKAIRSQPFRKPTSAAPTPASMTPQEGSITMQSTPKDFKLSSPETPGIHLPAAVASREFQFFCLQRAATVLAGSFEQCVCLFLTCSSLSPVALRVLNKCLPDMEPCRAAVRSAVSNLLQPLIDLLKDDVEKEDRLGPQRPAMQTPPFVERLKNQLFGNRTWVPCIVDRKVRVFCDALRALDLLIQTRAANQGGENGLHLEVNRLVDLLNCAISWCNVYCTGSFAHSNYQEGLLFALCREVVRLLKQLLQLGHETLFPLAAVRSCVQQRVKSFIDRWEDFGSIDEYCEQLLYMRAIAAFYSEGLEYSGEDDAFFCRITDESHASRSPAVRAVCHQLLKPQRHDLIAPFIDDIVYRTWELLKNREIEVQDVASIVCACLEKIGCTHAHNVTFDILTPIVWNILPPVVRKTIRHCLNDQLPCAFCKETEEEPEEMVFSRVDDTGEQISNLLEGVRASDWEDVYYEVDAKEGDEEAVSAIQRNLSDRDEAFVRVLLQLVIAKKPVLNVLWARITKRITAIVNEVNDSCSTRAITAKSQYASMLFSYSLWNAVLQRIPEACSEVPFRIVLMHRAWHQHESRKESCGGEQPMWLPYYLGHFERALNLLTSIKSVDATSSQRLLSVTQFLTVTMLPSVSIVEEATLSKWLRSWISLPVGKATIRNTLRCAEVLSNILRLDIHVIDQQFTWLSAGQWLCKWANDTTVRILLRHLKVAALALSAEGHLLDVLATTLAQLFYIGSCDVVPLSPHKMRFTLCGIDRFALDFDGAWYAELYHPVALRLLDALRENCFEALALIPLLPNNERFLYDETKLLALSLGERYELINRMIYFSLQSALQESPLSEKPQSESYICCQKFFNKLEYGRAVVQLLSQCLMDTLLIDSAQGETLYEKESFVLRLVVGLLPRCKGATNWMKETTAEILCQAAYQNTHFSTTSSQVRQYLAEVIQPFDAHAELVNDYMMQYGFELL